MYNDLSQRAIIVHNTRYIVQMSSSLSMTMKRILTIALLVLGFKAMAQQEFQSSQFMVNPFLINPAYSSAEDLFDVQASYRKQWVGIEGAPVTQYLSVHTPVGKPHFARTHPGDFHNWHGTGLVLMQDKVGPISFTRAQANYSYNLGLTKGRKYGYQHVDGLRVALGTFVGIHNYSVDMDYLKQSETSTGETVYNPASGEDISINALQQSSTTVNISFGGLIYYLETYYFGASFSQILKGDEENHLTYRPHAYLMGAYKARLSDRTFLIPSFVLKKAFDAPWSTEINLRLDHEETYFAGVSLRQSDALVAMVGYHFHPKKQVRNFRQTQKPFQFQVYYSYDMTLNALGKNDLAEQSRGSHEITVGILLSPKFSERNAEDTWR